MLCGTPFRRVARVAVAAAAVAAAAVSAAFAGCLSLLAGRFPVAFPVVAVARFAVLSVLLAAFLTLAGFPVVRPLAASPFAGLPFVARFLALFCLLCRGAVFVAGLVALSVATAGYRSNNA